MKKLISVVLCLFLIIPCALAENKQDRNAWLWDKTLKTGELLKNLIASDNALGFAYSLISYPGWSLSGFLKIFSPFLPPPKQRMCWMKWHLTDCRNGSFIIYTAVISTRIFTPALTAPMIA